MSCPETDTTLLWLYGEADDAHATHVAACPVCAEIAEEHATVTSALGPALAGLAQPRDAPPSMLAPSPPGIRPANRARWGVLVVAMAVAAAWVVGVWVSGQDADPQHVAGHDAADAPSVADAPVDTAIARTAVVVPSTDVLDLRMDALDLELDVLSLDVETL